MMGGPGPGAGHARALAAWTLADDMALRCCCCQQGPIPCQGGRGSPGQRHEGQVAALLFASACAWKVLPPPGSGGHA